MAEMNTDFMLKTRNRIRAVEDGTLLAVFLDGMVFTGAGCGLLGAPENYLQLVREYVFWYALFAIPNTFSLNLQPFCRNEGNFRIRKYKPQENKEISEGDLDSTETLFLCRENYAQVFSCAGGNLP